MKKYQEKKYLQLKELLNEAYMPMDLNLSLEMNKREGTYVFRTEFRNNPV